MLPRRLPSLLSAIAAAALVCGCGGGERAHRGPRHTVTHVAHAGRRSPPRPGRPRPQAMVALVTAEAENRLLEVSVPAGRVLRRIALPAGPEYVTVERGLALATSVRAGTVAVLVGSRLRVTRVLHGFATPMIVALTPDGEHAYVSDDARGAVSVIRVAGQRVVRVVHVGLGAHHMAVSPDQHRLWVALGESASTIVRLDTTDVEHPRVVGRFDPGFAVHDLAFSPDGRQVWITSATGPDVTVVSAATRRALFRVPVGRPPQHVAFAGDRAYLTSGYGSSIEEVSVATGRVLRRARSPYGSFELDAAGGYVVTASLLDGRVAIYTDGLRLRRVVAVAPATRDLTLTSP